MNSVFVNTQGLYQRRRAFNMSYRNDYTCNLGEIIPVYLQDLIPNTSWRCSTHGLVRFLPMIAPIMDNVDMYVHFWISPVRTLYGEDFTETLTGEKEADEWPGIFFTPLNIAVYLAEYNLTADEVKYLVGDGSIFDMLGYDTTLFVYDEVGHDWDSSSAGKLNARKFCMYFRLLSNWYTNENVDPFGTQVEQFFDFVKSFDKLDFLKYYQDGDISALIAGIIRGFYKEYGTAGFAPHAWPKDYGTSALPTLQYGLPTYLPLGDTAPVIVKPGTEASFRNTDSEALLLEANGMPDPGNPGSLLLPNDGKLYWADSVSAGEVFKVANINEVENFQADLTEATAITINELRITNALQVFKEREIRYGRKAPEYYKGFYGVTPGDLRLQLPKFLGGGRIPINISDVEQTSASQSGSAQGNLAGKGTAIAAGFAYASAFAPEESFIMGVAWLMPKVTYARCLSRHDTKLNDRFDYYNPSFAHIGEQPVFNYEMYAGSYGSDQGNKEFGYQPRYTEYRFHLNEMHGEFKNNLSYWTLGRIYDSQPTLNNKFIYMQPKALNRIFAVQTTTAGFIARNVLASLKFNVSMIQPLSRYGTPGLMP